MNLKTETKSEALLQLARLRQATRLEGHDCIGDFHGGIFECDYVSPYTKSADNINARVMVVAQDWASADSLSAEKPDRDSVELGYTPNLRTNRNLHDLLKRHFGLSRGECYMTNLFPFIKRGPMDAYIPRKDMVRCAKEFTLEEIRIVNPRMVICLGLKTFQALRTAVGHSGSWSLKLGKAISTPFRICETRVHCVAHTGAHGTNNRGSEQVERDWENLARVYRSARRSSIG